MKKPDKKGVFKWFTRALLTAGLIAVGASQPVATSLGPVINDNIWRLFDGDQVEQASPDQGAAVPGLDANLVREVTQRLDKPE